MWAWFGKFFNSMFEDNSGGESTLRVVFFLWMLALIGLWIYFSFHTGGMVAIPDSVFNVTAMLVGGKVVQRFGEKKE